MINEQEVGDEIERRLAELRARADPRVFDQAVELLQLFGELYGEGLARVMIHKLVYTLLLGAITAVVVKSLPDIARYLKMREM